MKERWKRVKDFPDYEISNLGNIVSFKIRNGKGISKLPITQMKPKKDKDGYLIVNLRSTKLNKHVKVHRLVAQAFLRKSKKKLFVNHLNGIKDDNRVKNLEWCTPLENNLHSLPNVYCKELDLLFNSCKEAALYIGCTGALISMACRGKLKTAKKLHWEYIN